MKHTLPLAGLAAAILPTVLGQNFFVQYTPGGDDTSVQRIDPIINPGTVSQHVHQLFGGSNLAATLSTSMLQSSSCSNVGAADGQQNTQDHSIYWVPSLYMEANDGSGYVRIPTNGHKTYYIDTGVGEAVEPFDFPEDFRMVAGDPENRSPISNGAVTWTCFSGGSNVGSNGAFPSGVSTCETYPYLNAEIEFPHCWNGNAFNPASPYSHMAYPEGNPRSGTCPSSHPKRLPHLFIETFYMLDSTTAAQVKPDTFVLSQGDRTGYGFHADFFNGWDTGAISNLLPTCPAMNEDIGKCPNFKGSGATSSCSLPTQYKENVDTPSPYLPGCNPITGESSSPAVDYAPAALGADTNKCNPLSGSSTNSTSSAPGAARSSGAAPASSAAATSSPSAMAATSGAPPPASAPSSAAGSWGEGSGSTAAPAPVAAPASAAPAGYANSAPASPPVAVAETSPTATATTSFATVYAASTVQSGGLAETPAWMSNGGWESGGGWNKDRVVSVDGKKNARRHLHLHQHHQGGRAGVGRSLGMRV